MSSSHRSWLSHDEDDYVSQLKDEPWDTDEDIVNHGVPVKRSRKYSSSSSGASSSRAGSSSKRRSLSYYSPPYSARNSHLKLSADADTELMCHRKRALALGNFKFLYRVKGGVALADTKAFRDTLRAFNGKVRYVKVPSGFVGSHYPLTRYSKVKLKEPIPGQGNRFNVVWSLPSGDVQIDYSVKLYDFHSIHSVEIDCDAKSPKSPWFGLVDPRIIPTYDEKVNFDANIFWTVAFLYKHFGTCGIETWDKEIHDLKKDFIESQDGGGPSKGSRPSSSLYQSSPTGALKNENLVLLTGNTESNPAVSSSLPEEWNTRYTGCVTEWRGNFGFLSCTHICGRVFLHVSDILRSSESKSRIHELPIGASVNFELTLDTQNRYKAIGAKLFL